MNRWKRLLILLAVFGGGWLSSSAARVVIPFLRDERVLQCIPDSNVCVGAPIAKTSLWGSKVGGVTNVECSEDDDDPAVSGAFPRFLEKTCAQPNYLVWMSDGNVNTQVWVDGGRVTKIRQHSAIPFDP